MAYTVETITTAGLEMLAAATDPSRLILTRLVLTESTLTQEAAVALDAYVAQSGSLEISSEHMSAISTEGALISMDITIDAQPTAYNAKSAVLYGKINDDGTERAVAAVSGTSVIIPVPNTSGVIRNILFGLRLQYAAAASVSIEILGNNGVTRAELSDDIARCVHTHLGGDNTTTGDAQTIYGQKTYMDVTKIRNEVEIYYPNGDPTSDDIRAKITRYGKYITYNDDGTEGCNISKFGFSCDDAYPNYGSQNTGIYPSTEMYVDGNAMLLLYNKATKNCGYNITYDYGDDVDRLYVMHGARQIIREEIENGSCNIRIKQHMSTETEDVTFLYINNDAPNNRSAYESSLITMLNNEYINADNPTQNYATGEIYVRNKGGTKTPILADTMARVAVTVTPAVMNAPSDYILSELTSASGDNLDVMGKGAINLNYIKFADGNDTRQAFVYPTAHIIAEKKGLDLLLQSSSGEGGHLTISTKRTINNTPQLINGVDIYNDLYGGALALNAVRNINNTLQQKSGIYIYNGSDGGNLVLYAIRNINNTLQQKPGIYINNDPCGGNLRLYAVHNINNTLQQKSGIEIYNSATKSGIKCYRQDLSSNYPGVELSGFGLDILGDHTKTTAYSRVRLNEDGIFLTSPDTDMDGDIRLEHFRTNRGTADYPDYYYNPIIKFGGYTHSSAFISSISQIEGVPRIDLHVSTSAPGYENNSKPIISIRANTTTDLAQYTGLYHNHIYSPEMQTKKINTPEIYNESVSNYIKTGFGLLYNLQNQDYLTGFLRPWALIYVKSFSGEVTSEKLNFDNATVNFLTESNPSLPVQTNKLQLGIKTVYYTYNCNGPVPHYSCWGGSDRDQFKIVFLDSYLAEANVDLDYSSCPQIIYGLLYPKS